MTEAQLEAFLLRIALPPVRLGLYVKRPRGAKRSCRCRSRTRRAAPRWTTPRAAGA